MILQHGDKVLIAHRRLFEKDEPRFFVGEIVAYEAGILKVDGFSFTRDVTSGSMIRKDESRTKIVSISSYAFLVYQLPNDLEVASVKFENEDGQQYLTDGVGLKMNMAEHPHRGHL